MPAKPFKFDLKSGDVCTMIGGGVVRVIEADEVQVRYWGIGVLPVSRSRRAFERLIAGVEYTTPRQEVVDFILTDSRDSPMRTRTITANSITAMPPATDWREALANESSRLDIRRRILAGMWPGDFRGLPVAAFANWSPTMQEQFITAIQSDPAVPGYDPGRERPLREPSESPVPLFWVLDGRIPMPCFDMPLYERFMADTAVRRVAETVIPGGGGIRVSTVFLGLNYNIAGTGPPLLFETMVFNLPDGRELQQRYSTWEEAEEGHRRMVAEASKTPEGNHVAPEPRRRTRRIE